MGRKSDADSLQSRVRSAANQIKILDQKGVIDISSIQLWFGTLIGSFAALYIFWNIFIVEEYPRDHFPDHLKVKFENQKDLFAQYGGRQGIAHQIQVSFVACSESQVDDVIASVKNLAILSVTPIHAVFFTQDGVMKRLLKEVELFSQQIPGRLTVDWQFGKGNVTYPLKPRSLKNTKRIHRNHPYAMLALCNAQRKSLYGFRIISMCTTEVAHTNRFTAIQDTGSVSSFCQFFDIE